MKELIQKELEWKISSEVVEKSFQGVDRKYEKLKDEKMGQELWRLKCASSNIFLLVNSTIPWPK